VLRPGHGGQGPGPGKVARCLCTITRFSRYAVEEELLDHARAVHVRRPRLNCPSHATALDRNEVGALLVAAGRGTAQAYALMDEVERGLIPADSPPDFLREDWVPDAKGLPGWFGPDCAPTEDVLDAFAKVGPVKPGRT